MGAIRAVVCDVDGTITDSGKRIQALGMECLRRVQANGATAMIASGNVLPVAYGLSQFIGLDSPVIAENGGVVSYREQIFELHSPEVPEKAFLRVKERVPGAERLFTDNWRRTEVALKRSTDLDAVRKALDGWPVEVEATGFAIHIMERGHGKMSGVRKACDLIGISPQDVLAIGDADNDVGMLRGCGHSAAVGNAQPAAKAAARFVARRDHSEGVLEALQHHGLL
jgi:phosphoglycolate phosphatase (TIGR01487 family)